jgi:hypothetical protein
VPSPRKNTEMHKTEMMNLFIIGLQVILPDELPWIEVLQEEVFLLVQS